MTYLSLLTLNVAHAQVRHDLGSRYEQHRTLCWAFDEPATARVLWRMEAARPDEPPRLLVQSLAAPDWGRVEARHTGYFCRHECKPLDWAERLTAGQRLRFRLEANPTVTRGGKRHGLWREEEQLAWLARQAERGGFAIEGAGVARAERLAMRKGDGARPIVLHAVTFEGRLLVREAATLAETLAAGIGHGKALGLGLLSVG